MTVEIATTVTGARAVEIDSLFGERVTLRIVEGKLDLRQPLNDGVDVDRLVGN